MTMFNGFPRAGYSFLADLEKNNNREWFEENRLVYEAKLIAPAQLFVVELGRKLSQIYPDVVYDTRLNGSGSLMRIYRDTRFSKDKRPYKSRLGIFLYEGDSKHAAPGFFMSISPAGGYLGAGKYRFPPEMLERYRKAVVDPKKGPSLVRAINTATGNGALVLAGEEYKRVPRDFDPGHRRADLLRRKGLHVVLPELSTKVLCSASVVDKVFLAFKSVAPLHRWLRRL